MTETSLAALAAESAIRRLISAYCDAVCRRDAEAAGKLFAPDAHVHIADYPALFGREAILEGMRQSFGHFSLLHQKCDTGLIDVEGDRANARLAVFEVNRPYGEDGVGLIFGWYEDEYTLLDEGWRFLRRRFILQQRVMVPTSKIQEVPDIAPGFTFSV